MGASSRAPSRTSPGTSARWQRGCRAPAVVSCMSDMHTQCIAHCLKPPTIIVAGSVAQAQFLLDRSACWLRPEPDGTDTCSW